LRTLYNSIIEMENKTDYIRVLRKAQLGDKLSLAELAEMADERLRTDVYRLTLDHDLTCEIVQESILEMFKILRDLKEANSFWSWLYQVALNKLHNYKRSERRQRSDTRNLPDSQKDCEGAIADVITNELKEIVVAAMKCLGPRQRMVLTLRCYREMQYSAIAESMGCSEFAAKMLFYRAKKTLRKQLSRQGFGKGSLVMALVIFGKMTAPSKAAAATVSVSGALTQTGMMTSLAALATSKAAIISLTTAGVLTVGTIVGTNGPDKTTAELIKPAVSSQQGCGTKEQAENNREYWYFFPQGKDGPVIKRVMGHDKDYYCLRMQDEHANYHYDRKSNTVYINNYRLWHSDMSVWRLPTDDSGLRGSLRRVEGESEEMDYISGSGDSLVVVSRKKGSDNQLLATYHRNILNEEYFRYNWPAGVKLVDNRDEMHKRGWTYFTVTGQINGKEVKGFGRLPFVYASSEQYYPWIRLQVGKKKMIEGAGDELFKGLCRPWMGLHTVDMVRRDAAEKKLLFETEFTETGKARITVMKGQDKLFYTINMKKDIVEKIEISKSDGRCGELEFSYLEGIEHLRTVNVPPRNSFSSKQKDTGILWLIELLDKE